MNNIKFRAWYKYQNKMVDVLQINFTRKRAYIEADKKGNPFGYIGFDDCILMQNTGMFDKNNKELFEGDIIRCKCGSNPLAVIKKDRYQFFPRVRTTVICGGFTKKISWVYVVNGEIVGNIYENGDLFK